MKLNIKSLITILFCLFFINSVYGSSGIELTLSNGLKVFIKPMKASPIVTINFWVKNGSIYENDGESGFSELISKLLFSNSVNYPNHKLKYEFENIGVKIGKNSSNDCQCYYFTGISQNTEKMLKLAFDGLFAATFSDSDINYNIKELKKEIQFYETKPDIVVENAMMQEAFAIHPCRRPFYGLNPNFDSADLFILNRFYTKNYAPSNSVLIITGDVNLDIVIPLLNNLAQKYSVSNYTKPELPKEIKQTSYREVIKYANVQKAYLSLGWKIPYVEGSDKYALYVLAHLLGGSENSILWNRLAKGRETCEKIWAEYKASCYKGVLVISAISSKSKARYLVDDVRRIANGLIEERLSETYLEEIKKSIVNEHIFSKESVENAALDYGSFAIVTKASDADNFDNGIISVNYEDVRRVAAEYLRDENLSVAILHSKTEADNSKPVMLTLENGTKLILKENHASPVISLSAKFVAGGLKEDKKYAGISTLAGELLYRSFDSDEKTFKSKFDKIGAILSYSSCKNYVSVNLKTLSSNFIPSFDLFIKMIEKPEFPTMYSKARSVLENQLKEENENIKLQSIYASLKGIFGNSPLTYSDFGKLEDLSKTKRVEVIDYYKKNFIPSNLVIAIVGDFYAVELRDYLIANLGRLSNTYKNTKETNKTTASESAKIEPLTLIKNDSDIAYINFISKSITSNNKKIVALDIATHLLEESINESLKDAEKLATFSSSVEIINKSFLNDGYFLATLKTHKNNIASATQILQKEVEIFKKNNIPSFKLQYIKNQLYTDYIMKLTDSLAFADTISRDEVLGLGFDYYSKHEDILSAVSVSDIMEVSREYILPEKKYTIGVSSANSDDLTMEENKLEFKKPKENVPEKETKTDAKNETTEVKPNTSNKDVSKDNKPTKK